jgi:hypothetical protein
VLVLAASDDGADSSRIGGSETSPLLAGRAQTTMQVSRRIENSFATFSS